MRIASKVATGSGLLILLLGVALIYQVSFGRRLAGKSDRVSSDYFQVAIDSLETIRHLERMEELLRGMLAVQDPRYGENLKLAAVGVDERLADLKGRTPASADVTERVESLVRLWSAFPLASDQGRPEGLLDLPPPRQAELQDEYLQQIGALQAAAQAVKDITQYAINEESRLYVAASLRAQRVSWTVLGISLVLSLIVLLGTVRAINEPLKRLGEVTRKVRGGRLSVRLEVDEDDEFADLATDFNRMVSALSQLDQLKKEFLSRVSHELKTPLVAMQETNQLLLDGLPGELTPRQRRLVELNLQSGRRLSGMIVKLLDLSTLETGIVQYDLKARDLTDLLYLAVDQFEGPARERDITFDLDLGPRPLIAQCDGDRLYQVFENLLENAIKFSPRGSTVVIRATATDRTPDHLPAAWDRTLTETPEDGEWIHLTFGDQGPGVPDEHKVAIFEKFHQANRRAGSGTGVGLGLAICREVVAAHRGAIWVSDGPENDRRPPGSVFHLLLHPARDGVASLGLRPMAARRAG
ncbi:MAG: HAMP domain-containing sensor histidine kinase [Acidobacteriota bacterium]